VVGAQNTACLLLVIGMRVFFVQVQVIPYAEKKEAHLVVVAEHGDLFVVLVTRELMLVFVAGGSGTIPQVSASSTLFQKFSKVRAASNLFVRAKALFDNRHIVGVICDVLEIAVGEASEPVVVASKLVEAFAATVVDVAVVLVQTLLANMHGTILFGVVVLNFGDLAATGVGGNGAVHVRAGGSVSLPTLFLFKQAALSSRAGAFVDVTFADLQLAVIAKSGGTVPNHRSLAQLGAGFDDAL